jgi:hypothetical protein
MADRMAQWAQNVSNDIKYGTDTTGVGTVLKKMGAHGVYSGNSQAVGDYMASLPLGALKAFQGQEELAQGKIGQGAGDLVGGVSQALTMPTSVIAPEAAGEAATAVDKAIPSAARAGKTFQALQGAIGEHTVGMTDDIANALADIKQGIDTGLNAPSVINKFVSRIADVDEGPLTYTEARQFYSNMGDLAASERMAANAKMQRLIYQVQHALGDAISTTADQAGKLQDLQGAMKEFGSAKKLQQMGSNAVDAAKKAAVPALFGAGAAAAYRTYQNIVEP